MCAQHVRAGKSPAFQDLAHLPDVSYDTLLSAYAQAYQFHIRRTSHLHRKEKIFSRYLEWYQRGVHIYDIAERPDVNYSPYLLARIFLERVLKVNKKRVSYC